MRALSLALLLFSTVPVHAIDTDRPDQTESAETVPAGRFQLEWDWVRFSRFPDAGGARAEAHSAGDFLLKVGLSDKVDFQWGLESWTSRQAFDPDGGLASQIQGSGDQTLRLKARICQDCLPGIDASLMPWIKIPSGTHGLSNATFEGGWILPVGGSLPGDLDYGLMAEFDLLAGSQLETVLTGTLSRGLIGPLGMYVEGLWAMDADGPTRRAADLGFTVGFGEDLQLDFGVNRWLWPAEGVEYFSGMAVRY